MVCDRTFLKSLCCAYAPSGCEDAVRAQIQTRLAPFCDRMETDSLGNLLCYYQGQSDRTLLLCAHMDEVGMMITGYTDDGMLTFSSVGGIHSGVLVGKRVTVGLPTHTYVGVICAKSLHLQSKEERDALPKETDLLIDIGAIDRAQAQSMVQIGDYACFFENYTPLGPHTLAAKALDDRLGCALLCDLLEALATQKKRPLLSLCLAFTVREELGKGSGAVCAAYRSHPDYALVLETTAVAHLPGVPSHQEVARLGEGGVLSYIDHGTLYAPSLIATALALAKEKKIAIQEKRYLSGGNDAARIHLCRNGIPTMALSAPSRYLHSQSCVIDLRDADAMLRFLWEWVDILPKQERKKEEKEGFE